MKQRRKKRIAFFLSVFIVGSCFCLSTNLIVPVLAREYRIEQERGERQFALFLKKTTIYEKAAADSDTLGIGSKYGTCYVFEEDGAWAYIESGSVRGFVLREQLLIGAEAEALAEELRTVQEEQKADASGRYQYTLDIQNLDEDISGWLKESGTQQTVRDRLVSYALEFVGNSYVWGSTDLEEGVDCSGYVQSIYATFEQKLPRTVKEQAKTGEKIAMEDALPGDLIFYGTGEQIYHVAIYIGNEKIVHAMNEDAGIGISDVYSDRIAYVVRILEED